MEIVRRLGSIALIGLFLISTIESCDAARPRKRKSRKKAKTTMVASHSESSVTSTDIDESTIEGKIKSLIAYGETLLGRPYRYRGPSPWAMDCSGYVSFLYSRLGIKIPHSSGGLSTYSIPIKDAKPGDLAFFKGRNRRGKRVGHVALVVANDNGELTIMHSTNSRGIIKHKLNDDAYFKSRFLHLGRLPEVSKLRQAEESSTTKK